MADEKILKPKSFRIDDETAEKFKEISNSIGSNQQETLAKLIEAYEFQAGKAVLTEKKADIEQFEKYVNALTRMFMGSLEDNQNITDTVKTEFEALLKSKDTTIQDLQTKVAEFKQQKESSTARANALDDENIRLNDVINTLKEEFNTKADDYEEMLKDKNDLNKALMTTCNDLKAKLDAYEKDYSEVETLRKNISDITAENASLKKSNEANEKALTDMKSDYDKKVDELNKHELDALSHCREQMQIELDKAVLETERKYQEQIQQLKEQKQSEIDKYQQKYLSLLERLQEVEKATNVEAPKKTNK